MAALDKESTRRQCRLKTDWTGRVYWWSRGTNHKQKPIRYTTCISRIWSISTSILYDLALGISGDVSWTLNWLGSFFIIKKVRFMSFIIHSRLDTPAGYSWAVLATFLLLASKTSSPWRFSYLASSLGTSSRICPPPSWCSYCCRCPSHSSLLCPSWQPSNARWGKVKMTLASGGQASGTSGCLLGQSQGRDWTEFSWEKYPEHNCWTAHT